MRWGGLPWPPWAAALVTERWHTALRKTSYQAVERYNEAGHSTAQEQWHRETLNSRGTKRITQRG